MCVCVCVFSKNLRIMNKLVHSLLSLVKRLGGQLTVFRVCPLFGGCPYFRVALIRGSTVHEWVKCSFTCMLK